MKDPFKTRPLSFGQVVYAISGSSHASPVLVDQLRYLSRLRIPFGSEEEAGRGNRRAYTFDHLFECGVAIVAWDFLKPRDIEQIITTHRATLRKVGRDTLSLIGPDWEAFWANPEPDRMPRDDRRIVLTDRHDPEPCTFYLMEGADRKPGRSQVHALHQLPHTARITGRHIALKSLVATLVFRGMEAPETKPGRQ